MSAVNISLIKRLLWFISSDSSNRKLNVCDSDTQRWGRRTDSSPGVSLIHPWQRQKVQQHHSILLRHHCFRPDFLNVSSTVWKCYFHTSGGCVINTTTQSTLSSSLQWAGGDLISFLLNYLQPNKTMWGSSNASLDCRVQSVLQAERPVWQIKAARHWSMTCKFKHFKSSPCTYKCTSVEFKFSTDNRAA